MPIRTTLLDIIPSSFPCYLCVSIGTLPWRYFINVGFAFLQLKTKYFLHFQLNFDLVQFFYVIFSPAVLTHCKYLPFQCVCNICSLCSALYFSSCCVWIQEWVLWEPTTRQYKVYYNFINGWNIYVIKQSCIIIIKLRVSMCKTP